MRDYCAASLRLPAKVGVGPFRWRTRTRLTEVGHLVPTEHFICSRVPPLLSSASKCATRVTSSKRLVTPGCRGRCHPFLPALTMAEGELSKAYMQAVPHIHSYEHLNASGWSLLSPASKGTQDVATTGAKSAPTSPPTPAAAAAERPQKGGAEGLKGHSSVTPALPPAAELPAAAAVSGAWRGGVGNTRPSPPPALSCHRRKLTFLRTLCHASSYVSLKPNGMPHWRRPNRASLL